MLYYAIITQKEIIMYGKPKTKPKTKPKPKPKPKPKTKKK